MVPPIQPKVRLTNENAETMIRLVSLSPDESDKAGTNKETKFGRAGNTETQKRDGIPDNRT